MLQIEVIRYSATPIRSYGVLYGADILSDSRGLWLYVGWRRICIFQRPYREIVERRALLSSLRGRYLAALSRAPSL